MVFVIYFGTQLMGVPPIVIKQLANELKKLERQSDSESLRFSVDENHLKIKAEYDRL